MKIHFFSQWTMGHSLWHICTSWSYSIFAFFRLDRSTGWISQLWSELTSYWYCILFCSLFQFIEWITKKKITNKMKKKKNNFFFTYGKYTWSLDFLIANISKQNRLVDILQTSDSWSDLISLCFFSSHSICTVFMAI